jgi:hypothetical protein
MTDTTPAQSRRDAEVQQSLAWLELADVTVYEVIAEEMADLRDSLAKATDALAAARAVTAAALEHIEENRIPTEHDDDWVHGYEIRDILAQTLADVIAEAHPWAIPLPDITGPELAHITGPELAHIDTLYQPEPIPDPSPTNVFEDAEVAREEASRAGIGWTASVDTPTMLTIRGQDGEPLLSITVEGAVTGAAEDASEAARVFVQELRRLGMGFKFEGAEEPEHERKVLRGALLNVLCNASNFPTPVQRHLLGQPMGPLVEKVADAILDAGLHLPAPTDQEPTS